MKKYRFSSTTRMTTIVFCLLAILAGAATARSGSNAAKKQQIDQMYAGYKKDFPAVKDIAPEKAIELWRQNAVVFVDTRKPEEMAVSMLPGAITKKTFLENPDRFKDRMVVAYCTISYRSGVFARDTDQKGIKIYNLSGGILAWIHAGGPIYDPQGNTTRQVHVFGDRWDLAPEGYETVTFGLLEMIF